MKHYGWGIVDKDERPQRTFRDSQEKTAHEFVKFFNAEEIVGSPFRVVELFYKDAE